MTDLKTKSALTRTRLLKAASRIFAQNGYQESTIAEICEQAKANIAAVNYHFGDKQTLYLEAWRYAFSEELSRYPADGGVPRQASPEQRLAGRIRSIIRRIAAEDSYSFAIIHKEIAQPTLLLSDILEKEINPQRQEMLVLLHECLGHNANEHQLHYCHASIMGQCFHVLRLKQLQIAQPNRTPVIESQYLEDFTDHVIEFSLAGIRAIQTQMLSQRYRA